MKDFRVPMPSLPKKYWVQPDGARLGKSQEYCSTLMVHIRVAVVPELPRVKVRSLQASEASTYTKSIQ